MLLHVLFYLRAHLQEHLTPYLNTALSYYYLAIYNRLIPARIILEITV